MWPLRFLAAIVPACLILLLGQASAAATPSPHRPKIAAAWYAGWHADKGFPLSKISWKKYTHMIYAFAETTPDVHKLSFESEQWVNPQLLPEFVKQAHKHDVKALISIGGWTGSRFFSTAVGSAQNRTRFVKTVTKFATKYKLDGLDFDWEHPGSQGIGCNVVNPRDTANFLKFLQELRRHPVGKKLLITAASGTSPFVDPTGNPSKDVSKFAKVFDYIALMNYDNWGPWSETVGPNAPLEDACAPEGRRVSSASTAVKKWSAAGIPKNKLVLGVPMYGHGFRVRRSNAFVKGSTSKLALFPKFDGVDRPIGDSWGSPGGEEDVCGVVDQPGGVYNFWGLVETGFLKKDGTPARGIAYRFDTCSQTPFVYNKTSEIMVSYDNKQSFAAKGRFLKSHGLGGFAAWEAGGDYKDMLLDSIRKAAGY